MLGGGLRAIGQMQIVKPGRQRGDRPSRPCERIEHSYRRPRGHARGGLTGDACKLQ